MSSTESTSKYKIIKHRDHVLNHSDTYMGSKEVHREKMFVKSKEGGIVEKEIEYIPAIFKLFDEILVNASDQKTRLEQQILNGEDLIPVKNIWVNINKEDGSIEVKNDGSGIDIEKVPEQDNKYPVEIIFGNLLAGTNFVKLKIVGGKNGYGAKLTNIFSTHFEVETVDAVRNLKYIQKFEDNMSKINKPIITKYTKKPFTRVKYYLDFSKFVWSSYNDDILSLFEKRVIDISYWEGKDVNVFYNGEKIQNKDLKSYISKYEDFKEKKMEIIRISDRWELAIGSCTDDILQSVSFVNSINTFRGGKHVDFIVDMISKKIVEYLKKKKKLEIKPTIARNQILIFLRAIIVDPEFTSQTKEYLSTPKNKFGSTPKITDKDIETIINKTDIVKNIIESYEYKNKKKATKTDGSKKTRICVDKLSDANLAGGSESYKCILILTEGDSAKSMAISGLSDRNHFGVFPLRGKLLNTKDITKKKIDDNKEITNLKKILGLKSNFDYTDCDKNNWPLRYGEIWVMADQDVDGYHIKALVLNMFHTLWPSLLKKDLVSSLLTPIVKVTRGKEIREYYNLLDYEEWKQTKTEKELAKYKIKYYKGLGTSNSKEARKYFKDNKTLNYKWDNDEDTNSKMDLAFNKKKADLRKLWLMDKQRKVLDYTQKEVKIKDLIDNELRFFSDADNHRSLVDSIDGLKVTNRKILWGCLKKGLFNEKDEIKVSQLSGYISEHAAYHHGDISLQGTIVNMAQQFVGSNNYSILFPSGQFGTRLLGGKDASSSRYIFTYLNKHIKDIFNKRDEPIYELTNDDGMYTEPRRYAPSVPWLLINGAHGIGTGFSTHIPCHKLSKVISCTRKVWKGKTIKKEDLPPFYEGFKGDIKKISDKCYISIGKYHKTITDTIVITELPLGCWTEDYTNFLNNKILNKEYIVNYTDNSTEKEVNISIKFKKDFNIKFKESHVDENGLNELIKIMKLSETKICRYSNMYMFDNNYVIKKFEDVVEIIEEFVKYKKNMYTKRKSYEIEIINNELKEISNKYRFIELIIAGKLIINNRKKDDLEKDLEDLKFDKLGNPVSFKYLTNMSIFQLTEEKFQKLRTEFDEMNNNLSILENKSIDSMWEEDIANIKK
jgi:DNA topoisomerase-2